MTHHSSPVTHHRLLIGLGVGSEAADAVAVRADGLGLATTPRVVGTARAPLSHRPRPSDVRDALAAAARQAAGGELSSVLAGGLIGQLPDGNFAECVAERTGLTVVS